MSSMSDLPPHRRCLCPPHWPYRSSWQARCRHPAWSRPRHTDAGSHQALRRRGCAAGDRRAASPAPKPPRSAARKKPDAKKRSAKERDKRKAAEAESRGRRSACAKKNKGKPDWARKRPPRKPLLPPREKRAANNKRCIQPGGMSAISEQDGARPIVITTRSRIHHHPNRATSGGLRPLPGCHHKPPSRLLQATS